MHIHDLLFALAAFFSEVAGTVSGFGSSTFFVPLAIQLETFRLVLALTAIAHCFGNTSKILLFRRDFHWRYILILAVPSILLSALGAELSSHVPVPFLQKALGVVLILVSSLLLFGKLKVPKDRLWIAFCLTALSGFATGLVGTGGAVRGLALSTLNLPAGEFVVLSAAIDLGGDFLRTIIYLRNGYMDWSQWFYIPLLAVSAYAGSRTGKFLLSKMNQRNFERTVQVFIFLSGILLLF